MAFIVATAWNKNLWLQRWFGGVGWRDYLLALPFCVGVLVVPFLPTAALLYLLARGRVPLAGAILLFLTFGYPFLRVKRPRAAWWVGTVVAVGSLLSALLFNLVVASFSAGYVALTWLSMIPFAVLNWDKLRPWTFGVCAAAILSFFVAMGDFGPIFQGVVAMGLMALFFLLPDRDNIPRAPIVVTVALGLLLARMFYFYFDVGGAVEVKHHPAARQVFAFTGQRSGWAAVLGPNPRFLTPSCNGEEFFIGANINWLSSMLVKLDPALNHRLQEPLIAGVSANVAQDCATNSVFVGSVGNQTLLAVSEADPRRELLRERLEDARIELLRLDRKLNRLYVSASNRPYLYILRASNLAEQGRVPFSAPLSDIVIDRQVGHDVLVATTTGEIARLNVREGTVAASVRAGFGQYLCKLALDEKHRRLFVASMLGYAVKVLDADTLGTIAASPQPRGNHYMQYDAKRDLLYVGNFLTGTVRAYSFNGMTLTKVWSVGVGKRVQYLTLDHLRDQLCFTSSAGGYCLSLERLHPAPAEEPRAAAEAGADEAGEATPAGRDLTPSFSPT